jgi:hypothetical protein
VLKPIDLCAYGVTEEAGEKVLCFEETKPQGLKPGLFWVFYGTSKLVR